MTLAVGTDSYISVSDADTYFDTILFPEPWTTTVTETKEKALKMATKKIDSLMLIGRKVEIDQPLEFPRSLYSDTASVYGYQTGIINNTRYGGWVDETEVTQAVKEATCEEALALIRGGIQANKRAELQRQGVTSFGIGPLSESYSGASSSPNRIISGTAAQLMSRYVGGSRSIV